MKKVFISHPCSADPERNREKADIICKRILEESDDILPISPLHLFSFFEEEAEYREDIMDTCKDLIKTCDELWVYGDSKGCQEEVQYAESVGVPVKVKYNVVNFLNENKMCPEKVGLENTKSPVCEYAGVDCEMCREEALKN